MPLHRGEREAILLAQSLRSDFLLIDEQAGRVVALSRNLPVLGTLGILEQADSRGMIPNFQAVLERLTSSGFFLSATLREQMLKRHFARTR